MQSCSAQYLASLSMLWMLFSGHFTYTSDCLPIHHFSSACHVSHTYMFCIAA